MILVEVGLHNGGLPLRAPEVATEIVHHLPFVERPSATQSVGLHVLVEKFIGVQLGTVARQEKHADPGVVLLQPARHGSCLVDRVTIHDEEDPSFHLPNTMNLSVPRLVITEIMLQRNR